MPARKSIVGKRFGRAIVLDDEKRITSANSHDRLCWCICDCGKRFRARYTHLTGGNTRSCGCLRIESQKRFIVHGHAKVGKKSAAYSSWIRMIHRCTNPKAKEFPHYGGRGIKICKRWRHSFPNFLADMGNRPPGLSLHRIDNDGNYTPKNCCWATPKQQARAKSTSRMLTVNGVRGCMMELAEYFHVNYSVVRSRLSLGWTPERAFLTRKT
jgi:hypothetical protein